MASLVLRETLNKLSFLELSAIVSCEVGQMVIDTTQNGDFIVECIIDCNGKKKPHRLYKRSEIDQMMGYIGEITEIMTQNHNTDEESLLF